MNKLKKKLLAARITLCAQFLSILTCQVADEVLAGALETVVLVTGQADKEIN